MFDTFNIPSLHISNSAVLTLYASGLTTGTVIESGHDKTYIVPITNGEYLHDTISTLDFAGINVTTYLNKLLSVSGYSFTTTAERAIVKDIKQTLCYVALNVNTELKKENIYTLPDGQYINLNNETFKCCEPLFDPQLIGLKQNGIHKLLYQSVMKCDINIQTQLFEHIVLGGGNTMFTGIDERLIQEINILVGNKRYLVDGYWRMCGHNLLYSDITDLMRMYVSSNPKIVNQYKNRNRKYSSWIGGSILSSLTSFNDIMMNKSDWDEYGVAIIDRLYSNKQRMETLNDNILTNQITILKHSQPSVINLHSLFSMNGYVPIYFYSKTENKSYLIRIMNKYDSTYQNQQYGVWKYDIASLDISKSILKHELFHSKPFAVFPVGTEHFKPNYSGFILDNKYKYILYIFGGKNACFGSLNLLNGKWMIYNAKKCGVLPICSPVAFWINNNILHIFGNIMKEINSKTVTIYCHIKYNKKQNKFELLYDSTMKNYEHLVGGKVVFISYLNKFMNFGGANIEDKNDKISIWSCDISNDNRFEWKKK
eukprot:467371_1